MAGPARPAAPVRSMLFVPGNRTALTPKAEASGADAIVFDLEDAVAAAHKEAARAEVGALLSGDAVPTVPAFVRINSLDTPNASEDLAAVVCSGLAGVLVPKVESPDDVVVVDRLLRWMEQRAGLPIGQVAVVPVLETAQGARRAYDIAVASERTAYMGGLGVRGGDVERSLGYRWTRDGHETHAMRSTVLIDVRAAGVPNPLSGMWADIDDLDGLARFAQQNRDLGYEGMLCIHPRHVAVINAAFTPTEADLERDRRLVEAMRASADRGDGAAVFEGEMIDEAMAVTGRQRVERYEGHARG